MWFTLENIYLYAAVPASVLLIIQTAMTLMGMSGEIDVDFDGDGDTDIIGGSWFTIFSVKNLIAFFTFFGWSGLWFLKIGFPAWLGAFLAAIVGCLFVMLSMGAFFLIAKLQRSGTLVYENAVGLTGEVYIPIPKMREGTGKIIINVQGAQRELEAITDQHERLKTGTQILVIGVEDTNKLLVTINNKIGG